jgi:hypothetical protein
LVLDWILKTDGSLWVCGYNENCQLDEDDGNREYTFVDDYVYGDELLRKRKTERYLDGLFREDNYKLLQNN